MRKLIIVIIAAVGWQFTNAQVDTAVMRQYLTTPPSKTEMIEKCRDRIFWSIICNERAKAEELMFYARTEFENDKLEVLSQGEMWLLAIWLHKYQLAATEMVLDSLSIEQYQHQDNHFRYDLSPLLADSIQVDFDFYWQDIENDESLNDSHRDFLLLFINLFENPGNQSVEIMNDASDEYLELHPMSEHEAFVRHLLRHKYKNIGPSIEFGFSCGGAFYSSKIGKLLNNDFAMNMYLGLTFHNFVLNGETGFLYGMANEDINFGDAIMKDGRTKNMFLGISVGNKIRLPYRLVATPTFGAGWVTLYPDARSIKGDTKLRDSEINSAHVQPVIGVELCREYPNNYKIYQEGKINVHILFPTIRYTYMSAKFDSPQFKNGTIHTVTIGLKYQFFKVKRDL
ncbi:MAG: hypothetical protein J6W13_13525 [Salinivirgaceae bacterium]|nr:hypothetical protein [Salinivirgaceae bacterium]